MELTSARSSVALPVPAPTPCATKKITGCSSSVGGGPSVVAASISKATELMKAQTAEQEVMENEEDEYVYSDGDAREEVYRILREVSSTRPSPFATGGVCEECPMLAPGLLLLDGSTQVPISLPLLACQQATIAQVWQKTLAYCGANFDTSVKTLSTDFFRITNPSWNSSLEKVVARVQKELGIREAIQVEAQLQELQLHEKGSYLELNQDSKKKTGLVGTLVVTLASEFMGGDFTVRLEKEAVAMKDQSNNAQFKTQFSAFYSGCEIEPSEVTAGCRLCLVYNLIHKSDSKFPTPKPFTMQEARKLLGAATRGWARSYDGRKLVIMEKHLYPKGRPRAGSSSATNTNQQENIRTIYELLQDLAQTEGSDLAWDRATVSLTERGCAKQTGFRYGSPFRFLDEFDLLTEHKLKLSRYGQLEFEYLDDMFPSDFFDGRKPIREEFDEPEDCGDIVAGKRKYANENAIVIWPRSKTWAFFMDNHAQGMIEEFSQAVLTGHCKNKFLSLEGMAEAICDRLVVHSHRRDRYCSLSGPKFMECLIKLGDKELAQKILGKYVARSFPSVSKIISEVFALCKKFGYEMFSSTILQQITPKCAEESEDELLKIAIRSCKVMGADPSTTGLARETILRTSEAFERSNIAQKSLCPWYRLCPGTVGWFLSLFVGTHSVQGGSDIARRFLKTIIGIFGVRENLKSLIQEIKGHLKQLCNEHGWKHFESILSDVMAKLCESGAEDSAVSFFNELAFPLRKQKSDQFQVCSNLASFLFVDLRGKGPADTSVSVVKRIVLLRLAGFCSQHLPTFIDECKSLDTEKYLYPFVFDAGKDTKTLCPAARKAFISIATHCATALAATLTPVPATTVQSRVLHHNLSTSLLEELGADGVSDFLRHPCKQHLRIGLEAKNRDAFCSALSSISESGEVSISFPNPRGQWLCVNIIKTKSTEVPAASLSCPDRGYHECILERHNEAIRKLNAKKRMVLEVLAFLPVADQAEIKKSLPVSLDSSNKRKEGPAVTSIIGKKMKSSGGIYQID